MERNDMMWTTKDGRIARRQTVRMTIGGDSLNAKVVWNEADLAAHMACVQIAASYQVEYFKSLGYKVRVK